jgi:hypothetical protein
MGKDNSTNIHHIIPKARWWTNEENSLLRIKIKLHEAMNTLFWWDALPQEQMIKMFNIVVSCLKEKYSKEILDLLSIQDPKYVYKDWLYRENRKVIWIKDRTLV